MNTTPIWVPILVAGLGLVGTALGAIGGVLITQRRADKRENLAFKRDEERERRHWEREDTAKTFELRRDAYVDFYRAAVADRLETRSYLIDVQVGGQPGREPLKARSLQDELDLVKIYGSPTVIAFAQAAQAACWSYRRDAELNEQKVTTDNDIEGQDHASDGSLRYLLAAIRQELGVPNDELPPEDFPMA
jgi:hypothetical protein